MTFLPTSWITADSLFSFGTVVAILLTFISVIYLLGAPEDWLRIVAVSASIILNLALAVLRPPVTALSVVLALVNSLATLLTVILAFEKVARPQLARYRK